MGDSRGRKSSSFNRAFSEGQEENSGRYSAFVPLVTDTTSADALQLTLSFQNPDTRPGFFDTTAVNSMQNLTEEQLRTITLRVVEEVVRRGLFDDFAFVHEDHAVGCRITSIQQTLEPRNER